MFAECEVDCESYSSGLPLQRANKRKKTHTGLTNVHGQNLFSISLLNVYLLLDGQHGQISSFTLDRERGRERNSEHPPSSSSDDIA